MNPRIKTHPIDPSWIGLIKAGTVGALVMLIIMVIQIIIFAVWPPPETVEGFFTLFQTNPFLGLLSMDLLYLINNTLLILIYLGLFVTLKREAESAMLIMLVIGLVGISAYFASNPAFEMLALSKQINSAASETTRSIWLGAGQALLEQYKGTAFNVYYVLNAVALIILAVVILRTNVFNKTTGWVGLVSGIFMSIPSSAGNLGMVFALLSLVPWAGFLILVIRRWWKMTHIS